LKTQGFVFEKKLFLLENDGVIKLVKSLSNGDVELSNFSNIPFSLKFDKNTTAVKIFQNNPNEVVYALIGTNLYTLSFDKTKVVLSLITDQLPKFEFIRQIQVDELTNTIYLGTDNRGVIVARPRYFRRVLPNNLTEGISTSAYAQFQLSNGNIQINTGQDINTAGNELFPTFYEGNLFFSSNGHPGLGGLDIYRLIKGNNGEPVLKNMGYPINSSKDDFAFSIQDTKGFFSTNRSGSDDILAFDFKQSFVKLVGKLLIENTIQVDKKVYLYQKNEQGRSILKDSTKVDSNGHYEFKIRPNQSYEIVTLDDEGNRFLQTINSDDYQKENNDYIKNLAVINVPLSDKVKQAKIAAAEALRKAELAVQTTKFIRAVDSLKSLTNDYFELHHPFDQVYIIEKDLPNYYKVIELVKRIKNKKIVIVSAADCNGSIEYNEDLSTRRANRIYRTLSKLSNNDVVIQNVGERELLKDCTEARKDIEAQVVNRYSYIFIIDKK
ncbi:MAG: hypothetical protein EB100_06135, partial [Crocinitomicaceae bacterium]|nr:hypothetical protein [Crocinitomicaceae bacterium]